MHTLGKIEKIDDLHSVWPHEAHDFSRWLSQQDNLAMLSDTIGISMSLLELESPVGGFRADLLAAENGTGRKIIIENQLEDTNHDHLGKMITYASGKDAEVVVWIVKRARDEHRQAIEWLNQHTDDHIGFFLLEIELWRIGDSPLAPKFNVVERPNNWVKNLKASAGLSDTQALQLEFWQNFNDYAFAKPEFRKNFSMRKAQPQHWYSLSIGSSVVELEISVNTQKKLLGAAIYIHGDRAAFRKFMEHKEEIEAELGSPLDWITASKDCRILARRSGDIRTDGAAWPSYFDWFCDMALRLRRIAHRYNT